MSVPTRFHALAHTLLTRQLARAGSGPAAFHQVFDALAPLVSLDQALAAGHPTDRAVPVVLGALRAATGAAACRLLLRIADGSFVRIQEDGTAGPEAALVRLTGVSGGVLAAGGARAFGSADIASMHPSADWIEACPPASLACVALPEQLGVLQLFNSAEGSFAPLDVTAAEHAAACVATLLSAARDTARLVRTPHAPAADPTNILARILAVALRVLNADRGWILLHDPAVDELRSCVPEESGLELRLSANRGSAASAFRLGTVVNIANAAQDERCDPAMDHVLGYRTHSMLVAPVEAADGRRLGVMQMVNRSDGPFTAEDEETLLALASQAGVTLEYGALFEQLNRMRTANESMLRSLSNGVLTIGMDGAISFVNGAALRILRAEEDALLGRPLGDAFDEMNVWVVEAVDGVREGAVERQMPNSEFYIPATDEWVPVNLCILPLQDGSSQQGAGRLTGIMMVFEDLQRERELRRTMSRYVSNDVIDQVMTGDGALLSGAIQPATTLFSDIRGFSSLSEAVGATGTVALLNEYFSYMEDVVANRSGIIDKYIGDAVMAVFGMPFPGDRDAENAVQAAADMLQALALLNASRAGSGQPGLRIGIGVATGAVLVGNIGSPKRMDFTVIGDPVNLASRLEGATKLYGADILMCGRTMAGLQPGRRIRRLDVVRVLGHEQPTEVFELLDHRAGQWGGRLDQAMADYAAGLERAIAGDWGGAAPLFEAAAASNPHDQAARLLASRCRGFQQAPPTHWDGTFNLTTK